MTTKNRYSKALMKGIQLVKFKCLLRQFTSYYAKKDPQYSLHGYEEITSSMVGSPRYEGKFLQAYQNNSTCGYASAVRGLPSNTKVIPREWYTPGPRRKLSPRQLGPSNAAFAYLNDYVLFLNCWLII